MTRSEMMRAVDRMQFYERDYDVIRVLIANSDDEFFVKVIEELLIGGLQFSDFYRLFEDRKYSDLLAANLESQQRLKTEIERTIAFRKLSDAGFSIDPSKTRIGVTFQGDDSPAKGFYDESLQSEVSQQIAEILRDDPSDDSVARDSKRRLFSAIKSGKLSSDEIMLFAREYIVPIAEDNQVLNSSDIAFMVENNLTEDQMRKIKSFSKIVRRNSAG
jgi:hypothetical protein